MTIETYKFGVGDIVKITDDSPLSGNKIAPPVTVGDEYPIRNIVIDRKGNQHLDLGLESKYEYISSWETEEHLPDGDKIHWVSPWRVDVVVKNIIKED